MSEDQNTNPNPLIPGVQRINTVSRNFLVNNRQTLRPVERVLRLDPQRSRELDVRGGFTEVLTRGSDEILERDYLSSFINSFHFLQNKVNRRHRRKIYFLYSLNIKNKHEVTKTCWFILIQK